MEELALIRTAQTGDERAFRALFDAHHQRVFNLAYRYLRNAADAEDVLQETFIKAYRGLPTFDPDRSQNFSGWINRICVNCSLDALRRGGRKENMSLESDAAAGLPAQNPEANPERTARNREVRERVELALGRLSPRQRLIFTMRHYDGYTTREIAEAVETTEGAVKKHLFRAVEALKRRLRRYAMEDGYEL
jgi:RNA polymerase sigma-70 factor (ECF subfamily)